MFKQSLIMFGYFWFAKSTHVYSEDRRNSLLYRVILKIMALLLSSPNSNRLKLYMLSVSMLLVSGISVSYAQESETGSAQFTNPFSQPDLTADTQPSPTFTGYSSDNDTQFLAPEFDLNATLMSVNAPMALINDTLIMLHEEIDGIRLLRIDEDSVDLRYQGIVYHVVIEEHEPELPPNQQIKFIPQQDTL